jgi:hypothetical protein
LTIKVESSTGGQPLSVEIDHQGRVTFGKDASPLGLVPGAFGKGNKSQRFRLVRRGKDFIVNVNDKRAESAPIDPAVEYDAVRLGLTAGDAFPNFGFFAVLYNLKIGPLMRE